MQLIISLLHDEQGGSRCLGGVCCGGRWTGEKPCGSDMCEVV